MGKNLIQQKRGKGSPRYRAPSFNYRGSADIIALSNENIKAKVSDIVSCPGHSAPLMELSYDNGIKGILQAPEGIRVGDLIEAGSNIETKSGNVMALRDVSIGTAIYNIESQPGDGGKFARTSGAFARIISKSEDSVLVLLPSGKKRAFQPACRAVIGIVAGSGRKEKPFLKAGKKLFYMKARNKLWPKVSGTSMNSVNHPFGGRSSHAKGIPTQSSRNAPPGRKVGKIAPKVTGRSKR